MELYTGIMSGTSMDGVDVVLVSFNNSQIQLIGTYSQPFPESLKATLSNMLNSNETSFQELGETEHQLALCYAEAVIHLLNKVSVKPEQVTAIGCHGQTIFHDPDCKYPFTTQLGDGNLLAAKTGIKTIADFRRMDMAFGGQGAPLVPAFHQKYFYNTNENRVILNLGGIANITILSPDDKKVLGFDTGPANCLMDSWIKNNKGKLYDKDGTWAASGNINKKLLTEMLKEPYFSQPVPKSTGRELFNLKWLEKTTSKFQALKPEDIQATLLELTAYTVSQEIQKHAPKTDALYVCGGGAYNLQLLKRLSLHLKNIKVSTTEDLGLPPQQVEAIAFAWLAMRRIKNQTGNLPSVTGASKEVLLGTIYDPAAL
jgi:anhydro-N-acetylmuramic acid kinase